MNNWPISLTYALGYYLLFFAAVLAIWRWRIKRRKEKPPLEFKLLRGPGESLRRRMAKSDEDLIIIVGAAALAPIVTGLGVFELLIWFTPHLRLAYGLAIMAVPMFVVLFFAGRYLMGKLSRARNDRLGYLGERAVGEALVPLIAAGYRVFHDVPAEVAKRKFNVDHVAVGPNGVFAIETKTRRKGRAREGFEAHKVAYDGRQLIWPWAEDTFGLKKCRGPGAMAHGMAQPDDRARLGRASRLGVARLVCGAQGDRPSHRRESQATAWFHQPKRGARFIHGAD